MRKKTKLDCSTRYYVIRGCIMSEKGTWVDITADKTSNYCITINLYPKKKR